MEPVTTIIGALATGAATMLKPTVSSAIKDAYEALKKMVQRRFGGNPSATAAFAELEAQPNAPHPALEHALIEFGADKDEEIVRHAGQLAKLIKRSGDTVIATGRSVVATRRSNAAGRDIVIGEAPTRRGNAKKRRKSTPRP